MEWQPGVYSELQKRTGAGPVPVTRFFIVDDRQISLRGLTAMLSGASGVTVVGHSAVTPEVPDRARSLEVDVIIFNLSQNSPDGLRDAAAIIEQSKLFEDISVILIRPQEPSDEITRLIHLGVQGCVTIDIPELTMVLVAQAVACGCGVRFPANGVPQAASQAGRTFAFPDRPDLTTQERRVLAFLASGLSNREISRKIGLSEATVKKHLSQAMRKIGVRNRLQAGLYASHHLDRSAEPVT